LLKGRGPGREPHRMNRAGISRAVGSIAAVCLLVASTFSVGGSAQAARPQAAGAATRITGSTGWVVGTAWEGETSPAPQARLRLRNVDNGRPVASTTANGEGRFHFERVDPGVYVVELLSDQDKVLAIGDLFGVTVDVEAVTLVRLTSKTPWFGGFFGNAA